MDWYDMAARGSSPTVRLVITQIFSFAGTEFSSRRDEVKLAQQFIAGRNNGAAYG